MKRMIHSKVPSRIAMWHWLALWGASVGTATSWASDSGNPESVALFNGKNLDGWYVYTVETRYDNPGVFQVIDNAIYVPGGQKEIGYFGGLITKEKYDNYRLDFEYKWGEGTFGRRQGKARDAGVLLHCIGPNGPGPWMTSYEFQIIEGGTGDLLVVNYGHDDSDRPITLRCTATAKRLLNQLYFDPLGTPTTLESGRLNWQHRDPNWLDKVQFRGAHDVESPYGQWTRCTIIAQRDTLRFFVNERLVNQVSGLNNCRGKILFQTEGAEVWYRNIKLTKLLVHNETKIGQ
jgi:hypothetical protein